jgi:hypothetical protein
MAGEQGRVREDGFPPEDNLRGGTLSTGPFFLVSYLIVLEAVGGAVL